MSDLIGRVVAYDGWMADGVSTMRRWCRIVDNGPGGEIATARDLHDGKTILLHIPFTESLMPEGY